MADDYKKVELCCILMADDCKKAEWRLRKATSNLDIPGGTFEEEESIRE